MVAIDFNSKEKKILLNPMATVNSLVINTLQNIHFGVNYPFKAIIY